MHKTRLFLFMILLVVAAFALAACSPQTVEVTRVVTETETITEQMEVTRVVEGEVVTEQVEVTRVIEVAAEEEPMEELPYGLTPGKPYDGTELNFLICCATAPQFAALNARSAEFTEMTGITVNWGDAPFWRIPKQDHRRSNCRVPCFRPDCLRRCLGPQHRKLPVTIGGLHRTGWLGSGKLSAAYLQRWQRVPQRRPLWPASTWPSLHDVLP